MKTLIALLIVMFSLPAVAQERKATDVTKAVEKSAKAAKKSDKKAGDKKAGDKKAAAKKAPEKKPLPDR
jgi:hypothetical protein